MQDVKTEYSYDVVPYESYPFPQSHPDRLATLGRIFGLSPTPVTGCRVLELGCASGGNLIPMAFHLPQSEFVGVDLSTREVEDGQKTIQELNLDNIRIEHGSILDVDESWGIFDYIIAHGIYSWVPDEVQEKILSICSANLAPQGIAYVSYNTYPGWHMREMIRHMMLHHATQFAEPAMRIQQARALINFLASSVPTENNLYGGLLKEELEVVKRTRDDLLFHEYLEKVNAPIYFYQFAERAARHGLQYLAEAELGTMLTSGFSKDVVETLRRISQHIIRTEQYMDFLRKRLFRQTLLCHNNVQIKRKLGPDDVTGLLVASPATPDADPVDLTPGKQHAFRTPRGATLTTDRPTTKAAFTVLRERWPRAVDVESLFELSIQRVNESKGVMESDYPKHRQVLLSDVLQAYTAMVVEMRTWQTDYVTEISEKPRVSSLAACMAEKGNKIVNQRHEAMTLDPFVLQLVRLLDGTHDRAALLSRLGELVAGGTLVVRQQGNPIEPQEKPDIVQSALEKAMDQAMERLSRSAVLVG